MPSKIAAVSALPKWPLRERPGFLARRLHQIHVALFMEACGPFEVTPVQYSLLSALESRGAADQTTLAMDVFLDRTTTTGALKRLEARGLVERAVSPRDQRARACTLTRKGRNLLARMEAAVHEAHRATLAALAPDEREIFIRLLACIVNVNSERTAAPQNIR